MKIKGANYNPPSPHSSCRPATPSTTDALWPMTPRQLPSATVTSWQPSLSSPLPSSPPRLWKPISKTFLSLKTTPTDWLFDGVKRHLGHQHRLVFQVKGKVEVCKWWWWWARHHHKPTAPQSKNDGGPSQFVSHAVSINIHGAHVAIQGKLDALKKYRLKLKDEIIEQCDGLPLEMHTVGAVIEDQILGKG